MLSHRRACRYPRHHVLTTFVRVAAQAPVQPPPPLPQPPPQPPPPPPAPPPSSIILHDENGRPILGPDGQLRTISYRGSSELEWARQFGLTSLLELWAAHQSFEDAGAAETGPEDVVQPSVQPSAAEDRREREAASEAAMNAAAWGAMSSEDMSLIRTEDDAAWTALRSAALPSLDSALLRDVASVTASPTPSHAAYILSGGGAVPMVTDESPPESPEPP